MHRKCSRHIPDAHFQHEGVHAWASKVMNVDNHNNMLMAAEGYQSPGNSTITVSEGSGGERSVASA